MTDVDKEKTIITDLYADLYAQMRKLELMGEFIKERFQDNLDQLKAIADNLERMGNDLLDAGVPGYGLGLKNEAKKLRAFLGECQ